MCSLLQKLLQKIGEQHIRQSSADSSGCSSGQESVKSSLTSADSQVSSDSAWCGRGPGVEPTGEQIIGEPAELEGVEFAAAKRRHNATDGSERIAAALGFLCKVAKTGEPEDNLSLWLSNLTDSTGYAVLPYAWSSTGYIIICSCLYNFFFHFSLSFSFFSSFRVAAFFLRTPYRHSFAM